MTCRLWNYYLLSPHVIILAWWWVTVFGRVISPFFIVAVVSQWDILLAIVKQVDATKLLMILMFWSEKLHLFKRQTVSIFALNTTTYVACTYRKWRHNDSNGCITIMLEHYATESVALTFCLLWTSLIQTVLSCVSLKLPCRASFFLRSHLRERINLVTDKSRNIWFVQILPYASNTAGGTDQDLVVK